MREIARVEVSGGNAPYRQDIQAGRHALAADEPATAGGADAGPAPYQYILAGLGACTSMTLRLYAQRKALPLERVAVALRHEKIHAKDCEECETKDGKVDRIGRVIELEGDLDDAQRRRMLEIADRCPVHRSLTGEIVVQTRVADQ